MSNNPDSSETPVENKEGQSTRTLSFDSAITLNAETKKTISKFVKYIILILSVIAIILTSLLDIVPQKSSGITIVLPPTSSTLCNGTVNVHSQQQSQNHF